MSQNNEEDVYITANPFVHEVDMGNWYNKCRIALSTVLIFPIRVILALVCLTLMYVFAKISLLGLSMEDLRKKPLTGWRRLSKNVSMRLYRLTFAATSFQYVKRIGEQASPKEAPILVAAPHSSPFDLFLPSAFAGKPCSYLIKAEMASWPLVGRLYECLQSIFVQRDDPHSRQYTSQTIIDRMNSQLDWPQMIICPEGTNTNRSSLITFKTGAFQPGLPVQPMLFNYPNNKTQTWTWIGTSLLKTAWLTMCQFHSNAELVYLPVYVPSEAEKQDPKLYANNVRNVMAKALNMSTSDYSLEDSQLMLRAKQLNIPNAEDIVEIEKLRHRISIKRRDEENILNSRNVNSNNCYVSLSEFAKQLQIPTNNASTRLLFSLFQKDKSETIDFRHYLLSIIFIHNPSAPTIQLLESISKIYETKVDSIVNAPINGLLNFEGLLNLNQHGMRLSPDDCAVIFKELDKQNRKLISFHDLKERLSLKEKHLFKGKHLRKMKCE